MFGWLFGRKQQNVSQSAIPPMILRDSWEACGGGFYTKQFRSQIEEVAKLLGRPGHPSVHSRFAADQCCAEIYDKDGTIVYITAKGEAGLPEKVIVTSDLAPEGKELFRKAFPNLRIKFQEMSSLF